MKIFLSQTMNGLSDDEIIRVREIVKKMLTENDELIDSFIEGAPAKADPLWYLGESIKLLGSADVVVFAPGWENARGCRIERRCAEEYGIPMLNLGNITIEE